MSRYGLNPDNNLHLSLEANNQVICFGILFNNTAVSWQEKQSQDARKEKIIQFILPSFQGEIIQTDHIGQFVASVRTIDDFLTAIVIFTDR